MSYGMRDKVRRWWRSTPIRVIRYIAGGMILAFASFVSGALGWSPEKLLRRYVGEESVITVSDRLADWLILFASTHRLFLILLSYGALALSILSFFGIAQLVLQNKLARAEANTRAALDEANTKVQSAIREANVNVEAGIAQARANFNVDKDYLTGRIASLEANTSRNQATAQHLAAEAARRERTIRHLHNRTRIMLHEIRTVKTSK